MYWFRRALVVLVPLALVFGIVQLLGGGGEAAGPDRATISAKKTTPSPSPTVIGPVPVKLKPPKRVPGRTTQERVPLAAPDGPCQADEVGVTPVVTGKYAGEPVTIDLHLAGTRAACTFTVNPRTVALRVTSGPDRIWSSQDCPRAIPTKSVVVRSAVPAVVTVSWSGRRSDGTCSASNQWARPGYYHAVAAALGSEPADTQFRLGVPQPKVITKTARPKPQKSGRASPSPSSGTGSGNNAD